MPVISENSEKSSLDKFIKRPPFLTGVATSCNGLKIQPVTQSIQIWIDLHHFPVEQNGPKIGPVKNKVVVLTSSIFGRMAKNFRLMYHFGSSGISHPGRA